MDSPIEYLSDNESLDEVEYDSNIEDVDQKLTQKNKDKKIKLSIGSEDEHDNEDEDDEEELETYDEEDETEAEEDDEEDNIDPEEIENITTSYNYNEPIKDNNIDIDVSDDSDSDYDDEYYQKFDNELKQDYIINYHSNLLQNNYDEVETMSKLTSIDNLEDQLHRTIPVLTKYEKTKVLGLRAKQIEDGSLPLVEVKNSIIDPYLIAIKELEEKKIPFIIRRPLPNGASEYWKVKDLDVYE